MAEIAVSSAAERFRDLLVSEASLPSGLSNEVHCILRELEWMQTFLKDADKKQIGNEIVRRWVSDTRDLVFKAEDIIEAIAMEVENKKQKSGFNGMLRRFARIYSEMKIRKNVAKEIGTIKSGIIHQRAFLAALDLQMNIAGEGETSNLKVNRKNWRMLSSDEVENDLSGREHEIEQIISRLKDQNKGCELISVCGMGGIGKTTLVRNLYNHVKVRAYFKAFAWVTLSPQLEGEKVFREVLKRLLPPNRKEIVSTMDYEDLVKELYGVQHEKNCLIVIDDIWTVDTWRLLEPAFPIGDATCCSKILLTTRNSRVAEIGSVFELQSLSEEASWEIFRKKSRINEIQEKKVAYEMEEIGRAILTMCGGLPLAISSLGGFLKHKSLEEWKMVETEMTMHYGVHNMVEHVLRMSYDSLPLRLKYCFLCFANYEEDEVIETRELYMIWIAEGLILKEDKAEGEMMLDVAERYLNELENLGLVQVIDSLWSKKRTCRVHDIMREFCLRRVKEEDFMSVIHHLQRDYEDQSKASTLRRLCICYYEDGDESMFKPFSQDVISHIRSVFLRKANSSLMGVWPDKILSLQKFKVLRVLTVNGYEFTIQNINNISELVYLKYLCLRYCNCKFKEFPSSIGKLRNLGTLDLRVSSKIILPNVLWKLTTLKHLYLPEFFEEGSSIDKLSFEGLNELELIHNYNTKYCDAHDLLLLPKLKVIDGGIILEDNLTEQIVDYIKSKEFINSVFEGQGGGQRLISILSKYDHDMVGSNDITGETSQPTPSL